VVLTSPVPEVGRVEPFPQASPAKFAGPDGEPVPLDAGVNRGAVRAQNEDPDRSGRDRQQYSPPSARAKPPRRTLRHR